MNSREQSLKRASKLKEHTVAFNQFKIDENEKITNRIQKYHQTKEKILDYFNATNEDWNNWIWQMQHRFESAKEMAKFLNLSKEQIQEIDTIANQYRFAIVPYYFALIYEIDDPIYKLSVPCQFELEDEKGLLDPMDEEHTNPAGSITRRYPDRLIINVTNQCAMYCRHCQRRRLIDESDHPTSIDLIEESIEYVRNNPEIRDVLLTGGDALLLSDNSLEHILKSLRQIPHVEIIRIGSRTPVTLPMRITNELVEMIQKYHPVFLNTHFNHFYELSLESKTACKKLVDHGIVVGNQAVLLKGINDTPFKMTLLNQMLLRSRVRPYYIFHAKNVRGTRHFIPKLEDGLKIMEFMRGNTSGLAIPTYIMNAPLGYGKVPLLPKYIIKKDNNTYTIRTWENREFQYTEK